MLFVSFTVVDTCCHAIGVGGVSPVSCGGFVKLDGGREIARIFSRVYGD